MLTEKTDSAQSVIRDSQVQQTWAESDSQAYKSFQDSLYNYGRTYYCELRWPEFIASDCSDVGEPADAQCQQRVQGNRDDADESDDAGSADPEEAPPSLLPAVPTPAQPPLAPAPALAQPTTMLVDAPPPPAPAKPNPPNARPRPKPKKRTVRPRSLTPIPSTSGLRLPTPSPARRSVLSPMRSPRNVEDWIPDKDWDAEDSEDWSEFMSGRPAPTIDSTWPFRDPNSFYGRVFDGNANPMTLAAMPPSGNPHQIVAATANISLLGHMNPPLNDPASVSGHYAAAMLTNPPDYLNTIVAATAAIPNASLPNTSLLGHTIPSDNPASVPGPTVDANAALGLLGIDPSAAINAGTNAAAPVPTNLNTIANGPTDASPLATNVGSTSDSAAGNGTDTGPTSTSVVLGPITMATTDPVPVPVTSSTNDTNPDAPQGDADGDTPGSGTVGGDKSQAPTNPITAQQRKSARATGTNKRKAMSADDVANTSLTTTSQNGEQRAEDAGAAKRRRSNTKAADVNRDTPPPSDAPSRRSRRGATDENINTASTDTGRPSRMNTRSHPKGQTVTKKKAHITSKKGGR